jgi:uncharacterized protein
MIDLKGKTALVTGASSGIGREIARVLARDVGALILVARRRERLAELAEELTASHPGLRVDVRPTDLADRAATSDLLASLERENISIDVLVNNAGMADYGLFAESGWERMLETIEVNVTAPTQLLQRLVPRMIQRGFGAILNVGSSAGSFPTPSLGVYSSTKAYVNALSEILIAELAGTGVVVTGVLPGPVETEFRSASGAKRNVPLPRPFFVPQEKVAEQAVEALKHGRARVIPGGPMRAAVLSVESAPKVLIRRALKIAAKRIMKTGG